MISPGPCTPDEAGISVELIRQLGRRRCRSWASASGTRRSAQAYGGEIVRAPKVMHGKTSRDHHDGQGVFAGLPNPFTATRYHSLIVERSSLPDCLEITAETDDGVIMGLRHRELPGRGRAVPPGVDPDRARPRPAEELPGVSCAGRCDA